MLYFELVLDNEQRNTFSIDRMRRAVTYILSNWLRPEFKNVTYVK